MFTCDRHLGPGHVKVARVVSDRQRVVLAAICDRLNGSDIVWAVSGSVACALQGAVVACGDFDLVTTADGARRIPGLLGGEIEEPVANRTRGPVRGHLGRLRFDGVPVDVLGEIQTRLPGGRWTAPPDLGADVVDVLVGGKDVPVLGLPYLREVYIVLGRSVTLAAIEAALARLTGHEPRH
jgi:hypothetical protein